MNLSKASKTMTGRTNRLRCASLGMAAMLLLSGAHRTIAGSAPELGLVSGNEYVGQQFFWNATWSGQWTADTTLTTSVPDQYEQLVLHGDSANFGVLFTYDTMADAFAREVDPESGDMAVLSTDAWSGAGDVPYLSATVEISTDKGPVIEYLEVAPAMANSFADGNQVTMLVAPEADFEQTFQDVQNEILPNGGDAGPVFAGKPAGIPGSAAGGSDQSPAPGSQPSDESVYLDTLSGEIDTLAQSLTDFQTLIQNPAWDDQTWKTSMANILFSWIAAYDNAQSMVPPDRYAEMHQTYVDFTALLAGAAGAIVSNDVDTATSDLTEAQATLMRLERMLESGGVDILDAKAG